MVSHSSERNGIYSIYRVFGAYRAYRDLEGFGVGWAKLKHNVSAHAAAMRSLPPPAIPTPRKSYPLIHNATDPNRSSTAATNSKP